MPETTQYTFTHKEIVDILVKKLDLKDGRWQLLVTFGFAAGNSGPDEKNLNPTGFVAVSNIGIQRLPDTAEMSSPNSLSVDAGQNS